MGFDANALYLYCAMQEMPTGNMIRRKRENKFRQRFSNQYGRMACEWLEYIAHCESIFIQHKYNNALGEKQIGQHSIPVDGYCRTSNTIYQFDEMSMAWLPTVFLSNCFG